MSTTINPTINYVRTEDESYFVVPGSTIPDSRPVVVGTATANSTISLYNGQTYLGTVTADATGAWRYQADALTAFDGNVSLRAEQNGVSSSAFNFTTNLSSGPRAQIRGLYDVDAETDQEIRPGNHQATLTSDATPMMLITGRPGATVQVKDNGKVLKVLTLDEGGNATWTITPPLSVGEHEITLASTDQTFEASPWKINVDAINIEIPLTINETAFDNVGKSEFISQGGTTDDNRPRFSGTAAAGEVVTIYDENNRAYGSSVTNSEGHWSVELRTELALGEHSLVAKTSTQSSGSFELTVIAQSGTPVTLNQYAYDNVNKSGWFNAGTITDDARPTFSGKAAAGQLVTLYDENDRALGSVVANRAGIWTVEISNELSDGNHTVIAKAGAQSSETFALTVQSPASVPLEISVYALDNVGRASYFGHGESTDDNRPTFNGVAGVGQLVTLYDEGNRVLGSVIADAKGYWRLEIINELSIGEHSIIAKTATQSTSAFNLIIIPEPVAPLTLSAYAYDNVGEAGYLRKGDSTDDTRPTFSGTVGAGQLVTLYDENNRALGSIVANSSGEWSVEISVDLSHGRHTVIAKSGAQTSEEFTLGIRTPEGTPIEMYNLALDNINESSYFRPGETTDDNRPTFSGVAGANQVVTLFDENNRALGSTTASKTGYWSIEITQELSDGTHRVVAKTASQTSSAFEFSVQTPAETPVRIYDFAFDDVGTATYFQQGGTTDDSRPTFSGIAGAFQLITLYDENNRPLGSVTANRSGSWSLEITADLSVGSHSVVAKTGTQTSNVFELNVIAVPETPVTLRPYAFDNVGRASVIYTNDTTDDNRPTFSGTAGAGKVVTLYDANNVALGSVTANEYGNWSLEITRELADGSHRITAKSGTQSSSVFLVTVDTSAQSHVTIDDQYYDNVRLTGFITAGEGTTDDTRPRFTGTGPAGKLVQLVDEDGQVLGVTVTSQGGTWRLEITRDLHEGVNKVYAKIGDQLSKPIEVNVDTHIPTPLSIDNTALDNVGAVKNIFNNNILPTDDDRPTFSGSAKAGETVTLHDHNNRVLGSAIADAEGRWELEITTPLNQGLNQVSAQVGSDTSNTFVLFVNSSGVSRAFNTDVEPEISLQSLLQDAPPTLFAVKDDVFQQPETLQISSRDMQVSSESGISVQPDNAFKYSDYEDLNNH